MLILWTLEYWEHTILHILAWQISVFLDTIITYIMIKACTKWAFHFFDVESRCVINCKLEGLNRVSWDVDVLPPAEPNLESKKCMHVVDLYFVSDSQQTLEWLAKEAKIQGLTALDDSNQPLPPPIDSRVSGGSIDHVAFDIKSTLVSAEVLVRYLLVEHKFRKYLKVITMEDHQWHLRSPNRHLWV